MRYLETDIDSIGYGPEDANGNRQLQSTKGSYDFWLPRINLVAEGAINPPASDRADAYVKGFEAKYPDHDITQARIANAMEMLAKAIDLAGTADDVAAVAAKLEGMEHDSIWGGTVYIRPEDHQAIQNVYIQKHTDEGISNALDNSEYGLIKASTVEMASLDSPTTCKMKRP